MARVCLCVLMNHPFPANLPLLRQIYAGRFSAVRFLIPFERMPDPDVITVYRGSYNHSAYLTDAHHVLREIDCDHYIVVHDDVLLNPKLTEQSFSDIFALQPDEGFIPMVEPIEPNIGRNAWNFGLAARMLFPKSMLFGTGVEPETLARYLPSQERLKEGLARSDAAATDKLLFQTNLKVSADTLGSVPSCLVLHGIASSIPPSETQERIEQESARTARLLISSMLSAQRLAGRADWSSEEVPLPVPLVTGNYFTDFYILPKSGFDDFCHAAGVAGAANLFVETIAPTLLFGCCDRVRTAAQLGLDFTGFDVPRTLRYFLDPRNIAIHSIKLSAFRNPDKAAALLDALRAIGAGDPVPEGNILARVGLGLGRGQTGFVGRGDGWHGSEEWGVWSAEQDVDIPVLKTGTGPFWLTLRNPQPGHLTGRLLVPGADPIELEADWPTGEWTIRIERYQTDEQGRMTLRLINDVLCDPPGDPRQLGFGVVRLEGTDL